MNIEIEGVRCCVPAAYAKYCDAKKQALAHMVANLKKRHGKWLCAVYVDRAVPIPGGPKPRWRFDGGYSTDNPASLANKAEIVRRKAGVK